jgi:hypothetical protein
VRPSTHFVPGLVAILAIGLMLASAALGAGSDLGRFVVHRSDLSGFELSRINTYRSLTTWTSGEPKKQAAVDRKRLAAEGFQEAVDVLITGPHGVHGVSDTTEFKTAKGAAAESKNASHDLGTGSVTTHLKVPAIPHAVAYSQLNRKTGGTDANVFWVEGRCSLIIGSYRKHGQSPAKALIAAAESIYRRTSERCP